jgi:phosphatidate cytidylyltransferase
MIVEAVACMFGAGALLVGAGNSARGTSALKTRAIWIKYFSYAGIVGGMMLCAMARVTLVIAVVAVAILCVREVLRVRAYWAAVWVAASTCFALLAGNFLAIYLVVAAADAFAQLGGRLLGGSRPWPRLSPQKTLSGVLCGMMAAVVMGYFVGLQPSKSIALALAGLAGDLMASKIKRSAEIKDFGRALPGQGGFMDRFDSLWGAAPLGAFLC